MDRSYASSSAPAVSIVAPCYNEADCLREFYRRAAGAARASAGEAFEIVLVDDGSRDRTWELIAEIAAGDPHVVGVRLMRNHGHQLAASAGLSLARGDRVMLIDADLQDPPELLAPMMAQMDAGADVVYGQRTARHAETWFKRATAFGFYRLLSRLAAVPIPRDTGDFRLMRRRVVEVLVAMPERQRFLRGLVSWIGGRQVALQYERQSRHAGSSKYPLRKMIQFAADAITSFSVGPLRYATYLGLLAAAFGGLLLLYTAWRWALGHTVLGWSSIMAAIALFSAVQLIVLGIQGEYIGRLFQEAKARPLFLIDTVVAEGSERRLPMEFCDLAPGLQREVWDAVRAARVVPAEDQAPGWTRAEHRG